MNHEQLHKIIWDNDATIIGSYPRLWLQKDALPDKFGDVDVVGVSMENRPNVAKAIYDATEGKRTEFHELKQGYLGFYCNTWGFDGKVFYQLPFLGFACSPEETLEQIKEKRAVMMGMYRPSPILLEHLIKKFLSNNWIVLHENLVPVNLFQFYQLSTSLEAIYGVHKKYPSEAFAYMMEASKKQFEDARKNPRPKMPSFPKQIKSFKDSMVTWAKQSFKVVDQDVLDQRISICESCEFFVKTSLGGRCQQCGCVTKLKTKLLSENCPIGKW